MPKNTVISETNTEIDCLANKSAAMIDFLKECMQHKKCDQ